MKNLIAIILVILSIPIMSAFGQETQEQPKKIEVEVINGLFPSYKYDD